MTGPLLTLADAATATGKSRRSLRRMIDADELDGARKDAQGRWVIPAHALAAAGYGTTPPDTAPKAVHDESEALRAELAEWRRRAEVAEAVAAERADALTDVRRALRMIEAGPSPVPQTVRWWRRSS